jgi:ubiquinone/menaquinone biosynthesis C-methylase UbiE
VTLEIAVSRKDVFGKAIMDAFQGKKVTLLIRRDDGFLDDEDASYYFVGFDKFPDIERKAMSLARDPVLDIGCGAGRHSLCLQSEDRAVVSMDISPLMIRVASERGVKAPILAAAPRIPFKNESFATIMLMFNGFGICGGYEETVAFLKELERVVRSGGNILASSRHPTLTKNEVHLKYHELNRKRGRPVGLVTIRLEYGDEAGDWFKLLLASPEEMRELCQRAGLRLSDIIGPDETSYYIGVIKKSSP